MFDQRANICQCHFETMGDKESSISAECRGEKRNRRVTLILLDLACFGSIVASLAIAITIGYFTVTMAAPYGMRSVYYYLILAIGCSAAIVFTKWILRAGSALMDRVLRSHLDRAFKPRSDSN
jgi:hypothetical protein